MMYWPQCLGFTMLIVLVSLVFQIAGDGFGKTNIYKDGVYVRYGHDIEAHSTRLYINLFMGLWLFVGLVLITS